MDKDTRNAIERATQRARTLLEDDFASQLEGTFDVMRAGTVAPTAGPHLAPRQVLQRDKVVAAIEHKLAAGMSAAQAVVDYLRDAAFTTLNRFVALKMLEARELVQDCISKGEQSSGYREFCGMAPGVALLPASAGYRLFIESLFDELSTEVKVLFDRRDTASVLWPKRATFEALLEVLNATDLSGVWGEDETIGWVYQFFNSGDERKRMREESQAPRNSRELAVRNQFFTPRYVVQFLTDNTLGRIWYEMRDTETALAVRCEYLVRKSGEEFAPRPKKDPRDLRVLDPACGSGHFLLYAFDLFLGIYEEAYADRESPKSEATGATLVADYPRLDVLRKAVPGLVLAHNLHGVDIDPRCAQIAQLALWMRAQRAYRDLGVRRGDRPQIRRSNIVIAEPLVADDNLTAAFVARLDDPDLARVFTKLVDALKLAGDLGILLPVETLVARQTTRGQTGDLFEPLEPQIRAALERFVSEEAGRAITQRRLFAEDAAQGLGLLATAEKRFDVILMNPPFGDASKRSKEQLAKQYPRSVADLGAVFVERGRLLLCRGGLLGAITNRTLLAIQGFAEWRRDILEEDGLLTLVDLGHGVLDAMVETAMYVCRAHHADRPPEGRAAILGLLESTDKKNELRQAFLDGQRSGFVLVDTAAFLSVPGAPWAYWVPQSLLARFASLKSFLAVGGQVCQGTATADDFRFFRLRWEVSSERINAAAHKSDRAFLQHRWSPLSKGGEYALWWDDIHLVQDWGSDGRNIKNFADPSGKQRSFPKNLDKLFLRGCTYPYRTTSALGMRLMPGGLSFSVGGWGVFGPSGWSDEQVLAGFNNRIARYFMEVLLGQGDSSASGTAARNHGAAAVGGIPWPAALPKNVTSMVRELIDGAAKTTCDESALFFRGSAMFPSGAHSLAHLTDAWWQQICGWWERAADLYREVEDAVITAYALEPEELAAITSGEGPSLFDFPKRELHPESVAALFRASVVELTNKAKAECGAKRYTVKKAYYIERSIDLASHIFRAHPRSVIDAARKAGASACGQVRDFAALLLSWTLGIAIGRFVPKADALRGPSELESLPPVALEEGSPALWAWVDDAGHPADIVSLVEAAGRARWGETADSLLHAAAVAVGARDVRHYFRQLYFPSHIRAYSKSRRNAPLYWQLSTSSGSYSTWLFYLQLTSDSLHRLATEIVVPKLALEERKLSELISTSRANASAAQRKALAAQESLTEELRAFLAELKVVAPLWKPNCDDGVVINFAPLWRLVPQQKPWQKELKLTWDGLCAGKYDWTFLAMHLWPERVVLKCAEDRSLAIAHGLEEVLWEERANGKWKRRSIATRSVEHLVRERTSPAVKTALNSLLESPLATPGGDGGRRRRGASAAAGVGNR